MKTLTFNILKPLTLTALFIVFAASLNTASAEDVIGAVQKYKSDHKCYRQTCKNDDDCGGHEYSFCKIPGQIVLSGTPVYICHDGNNNQDN